MFILFYGFAKMALLYILFYGFAEMALNEWLRTRKPNDWLQFQVSDGRTDGRTRKMIKNKASFSSI